MKNTLALLLLVCVFAYHFGYQAAYFSQQILVEKEWSEKIFSGSPLHLQEAVLEIPISVAYMPDQEYFQEANTTFEKDGRMYRIVKQRYHKDTLQIIYVPDQGKQNLKQLIKAWVTAQSGEDTSSDGIAQLKPIFKPYIQDESGVLLSLGTSSVVNETPCCTPIFPSSVHHSRLSPPPEIMC